VTFLAHGFSAIVNLIGLDRISNLVYTKF